MSKRKSVEAVAIDPAAYSPEPSKITAIVNDIHFRSHHPKCWAAFKRWAHVVRPHRIIFNGDVVDFGMLSRYLQEPDAEVEAIPQIKCAVEEINSLVDVAGEVVFIPGNHDERWSHVFAAVAGAALRGAIGLTLEAQFRAQGLDPRVKWRTESNDNMAYMVGQFAVNHGHKSAGKFGGGKHMCANRVAKTLGRSEVLGHAHRAQLFCMTSYGKTAIVVASPSLTGLHDYAQNPDWQNGFVVLEEDAGGYATPHVVIMDDGRFSWGGLQFHGEAA